MQVTYPATAEPSLKNKLLENAHYFDLPKELITFQRKQILFINTPTSDISQQLLTAFIPGHENQTDANHLFSGIRSSTMMLLHCLTANAFSKFFKRIGDSTNNDLYEIIKNTSCEYVNQESQ